MKRPSNSNKKSLMVIS